MPRGSKVSLERGELALRFVNLMHEVDQPRISPHNSSSCFTKNVMRRRNFFDLPMTRIGEEGCFDTNPIKGGVSSHLKSRQGQSKATGKTPVSKTSVSACLNHHYPRSRPTSRKSPFTGLA
jgi:hypothetical protein